MVHISAKLDSNAMANKTTLLRDTVSSVGIVRDKTLPGTTDGMKHVTYFRHALALDERRVKFLPEYAHEDSTLLKNAEDGITYDTMNDSWYESRVHTARDDNLDDTEDDTGQDSEDNISLRNYSRDDVANNTGDDIRDDAGDDAGIDTVDNEDDTGDDIRDDTSGDGVRGRDRLQPKSQHTKEVWFAGTHSDM